MIVSKIEKSCISHMWFKHSTSIAQQLIPIYNTTVHKNKGYVALNVVNCLCHKSNDTNRPQGWLSCHTKEFLCHQYLRIKYGNNEKVS